MATEENPNAGQGPVVLDIGGDVGALIVVMPASMEDLEVEIVPTGTASDAGRRLAGADGHRHAHEHRHDHHTVGDHHTHHRHDGLTHHGPAAPPHVAVVARPTPSGTIVHSLVFGSLASGTYDLYVRPDGPVQLTAEVTGGQITETIWPSTVSLG